MIRAVRAPASLRVVALLPGLAQPPPIGRVLDWFGQLGASPVTITTQAMHPALTPAERTRLTGPPEAVRGLLERAGGRTPILFLGPRDCRPHCWTLPSGTGYALVPADAGAAVIAHELGHLLFRWPDLPFGRHEQIRCLMGRIAGEEGKDSLVPPCTPLRVASGWMTPAALDPALTVSDQPEGQPFAWANFLIERQANRLAVFRLRETASGPDVTLLRSIVVDDPGCTTLALVSRAVGAVTGWVHHRDVSA